MSKQTFIGIVLLVALAATAWLLVPRGADLTAWPVDKADLLGRAIMIPAGSHPVGSREPGCFAPERVTLPAFRMWPVEVPQTWWQRYTAVAGNAADTKPAASVSYEEARAFCFWMSGQFDVTVRLPTVDEWQAAARAGTPGVTYPWGWSSPTNRAVYDAETVAPVASFAPNPWGFYDLAGNVAEWCMADDASSSAPVLGGSWAERSATLLRISHRLELPKTYRDADVGFRFVIEEK